MLPAHSDCPSKVKSDALAQKRCSMRKRPSTQIKSIQFAFNVTAGQKADVGRSACNLLFALNFDYSGQAFSATCKVDQGIGWEVDVGRSDRQIIRCAKAMLAAGS